MERFVLSEVRLRAGQRAAVAVRVWAAQELRSLNVGMAMDEGLAAEGDTAPVFWCAPRRGPPRGHSAAAWLLARTRSHGLSCVVSILLCPLVSDGT